MKRGKRHDTERMALAAVMLGKIDFRVLRVHFFRHELHREVFEWIMQASAKHKSVDPIAVSSIPVYRQGVAEELLDMIDNLDPTANADYFAGLVAVLKKKS